MSRLSEAPASARKARTKSAGGILIDPWCVRASEACQSGGEGGLSSNAVRDDAAESNVDGYRILIVNQRVGQYWGLPKGHVEAGEDIFASAMREVREETGIDLTRLRQGTDYLPIALHHSKRFPNHVVIKKIHFFAYLLLKPEHCIQRYTWDKREIRDMAWVGLKHLESMTSQDNPRVRCNRTLSESSVTLIEELCTHARSLLMTRCIHGHATTSSSSHSDGADETREVAEVTVAGKGKSIDTNADQ